MKGIEAHKTRMQERVEELSAVNRLARKIAATLNPDEVIASALEEILSIIGPDLTVAYLLKGDMLLFRGACPKSAHHAEEGAKQVGQCLCGIVARTAEPVYAIDIHTDPRCTLMECKQAGVRSFAALPLKVSGAVLGVLGLPSFSGRDFSLRANLLETLVSQVSVALQNAVLYEQVKLYSEQLNARVSELSGAHEVLRDETSFRAAVINRASEGLCVCHAIPEFPFTRFTVWNSRMLEITGYTMEEINRLGWYQTIFSDPQVQASAKARLDRMLQGEDLRDEEWAMTRADGRQGVVHISTSLIETADGPVHVLGLMHDVTERKRAEERLQEYEKVVEGVAEMIAVVDQDYRYLIANRTFLNYRDVERGQVVGRLVEEVLGKEVFEKVVKHKLDECFQGNIVRYEMKYSYPKIGHRDLLVSYFPIEGPAGVNRAACVLQDITGRKRSEEELRRSRDEMELRVLERTAELELANEKLRLVPSRLIEAQENERQRLAVDLHDSIGQTLAALKFRLEHVITTLEKREFQRALRLMDEFVPVLQLSIDETRAIYMGLKPTMLSEHGILSTLAWYRHEILKLYPKQHIELETAIEEADIPEELKTTIFRIVQEALNNTFKHGKPEWVDVRLASNEGAIVLEISDDGIGMDLDCIMESVTAKSLGLIGMRERTELTGGEFTIRSAPNAGTSVKAVWRNQIHLT